MCDGLRWFLGRIGLLQAYPFYGKTDSFLLVDTKTLKAHAAGFSVRVEAKLDDRGCIRGRPLVAPLLDGIDGGCRKDWVSAHQFRRPYVPGWRDYHSYLDESAYLFTLQKGWVFCRYANQYFARALLPKQARSQQSWR